MANSVATVASLEGQAWAKSPDGTLRPLKVGDTVTAEEVVITATGARIELDFGDGQPVFIAGGQEVLMNRDLWTDLAADDKEASVDDASIQEALTVLNEGGDLTTSLEETAAGLSGGGSNEGHGFVALTRVVEQLDPNAFNTGSTNLDTDVALTSQSSASSNNAPLADAQSFAGDEDTLISGRVIAIDVENDTLTYSLTNQTANGLIALDPATGNFTYTPNSNYNGPDSFVVTITDDHGNSTTITINLTVNAVNDAPVSNNQNLTTQEDTPVSGQVVATDIEGDTLTYGIATAATHGTVTLNPATGGFIYTPNADYNGSDSFIVSVNDGNGGITTSIITIGVTPVNDAPVSNNQNLTTEEDTPLVGNVVATDVDQDVLTYSITTATTHGTVAIDAATGAFVYTPSANYNGPDSFVVTIADGQGGLTTSTINIGVTPINDSPDTNDQNLETPEDTALSGQVVASDIEGDSLSYSLTTSAAHGTVTINPATGAFVYTPAANYNGPDQFAVSVSDGNGGVSISTINIGVTPVNDAPVSNNLSLSTPEDTPVSGQVLATDVDNDVLTYSVSSSASNGSVTLNPASGTFTYTPNNNFNGSDSFVVTVSDGKGGVATSVVTIGVSAINDAPITTNQSLSTPQNTPINGAISASDPDGDTLSYTVSGAPAHGTLTLNSATGNFVYTPNTGYNGSDNFIVTVSDGKGGIATSTISIGVQAPLNSIPLAADDSAATAENTAVSIAVRANDTDPDGDTLTVSGVTQGANGSVVIDAVTGNPIYTPNAGFVGSDFFTYTISDGKGGTDTATVTVTVNAAAPINHAPVAVADSITVAEGGLATTLDNGATNLLANDTDADGDALVAVLVSGPANGTLTLNSNGTFSYTHNGSETTTDSFTYKVNDGTVDGNTVTVNINVTPVNDAPVANNDTAVVDEGNSVVIAVRANDTDAEGDILTVSGVTQGANGSVVIDAVTGNPIYTPNAGFTGNDSFTYTIDDGAGGTASATVTVTVNPVVPVNHAPVAVADSITLLEGGVATALDGGATSVLANDSDADGNPLTAILVSGPAHGILTLNANGTFNYVHDGSETTIDSFTYKVNDGTVDGNTVTVAINVTPVNDAPVAVVDTIKVDEGGTVSVLVGGANSLLANDSDPENNPLTAILVTGPAHGSLTLNADGTFTYIHDGSETTSDSFSYKANDGTADSNVVTVNIVVTPVNDAPQTNAVTASGDEDSLISVVLSGSDVDGSVVGYVIKSLPANGVLYSDALMTTSVSAGDLVTGPVYFMPDADWNGTVTFDYAAQDNLGLEDPTPATATITVDPVADNAIIGSGSGSVKEDTPAQTTASGTLSIIDPDIGEAAFNAKTDSPGTYGLFSIDAGGNWTYTIDNSNPAVQALKEGEIRLDSFSVSSLDGTSTTVTITVIGTNDGPVAVADSANVNQDAVLTLTPAGLLANDTDIDGDTLSIVSVQGAVNGTVDIIGGNVVFTPTAGYSGPASFTYTVSDGHGGTSTATTQVNVIPPAGVVSLAATASITEAGGNIVYTATLTHVQTSDVTLTLANGEVITITAGQFTAATTTTVASSDDVYIDPTSIVNSISSITGGNPGLTVTGGGATTDITDTIDTTTISLTASGSVVEGGSIVYTATLTSAAQGAVTVNLSNGAVITIADGDTSGTVSVAAPKDDVYVNTGSVSASISSASGGNFEDLDIDSTPALTTVTDTLDTVTLSLTGAASITEGNSGSYTLSLTEPAQTTVTVTLNYSGVAANGTDISGSTTVTIPASASSANFSIAALTDGLVEGAESFTVSIASFSGGDFEDLVISSSANSVTTTIVDVDIATVSLAATPSLTEAGGTLIYTATIGSAPVSDLTVSLSNGETITILAGQTSGSTSVTIAASDDVYLDASSISATITGTSGGGIAVSINPAAAITQITDTIDTTTISLSATGTVVEGGSIVYTATLTNPAQGAVTVNLSNGSVITIADGATSGTTSVAAPNDNVYVDTGSVSVTIDSASGGNFEALAINPAAAVTTITDTIDTTAVSLSSTASVAEGGSIVYTATLTNPAQGAVTVTLSNGAVISIADGATSGTTSVAAPTDDVYVNAGSVSAVINSAVGGNFEDLVIDSTPAVTTVTDTLDTVTISLTGAASITEGSSGTYTLSLTHSAQTAVTVTLNYSGVAGNGTDISGSTTVTIPANASSANFSIAALTDGLVEGAESFTVSIASAVGGNFENLEISGTTNSVTTNVVDVDVATVSLSATPSLTEAGGTLVYTASIDHAPLSDLTVVLSNGESITIFAGQTTGTTSISVAASDDVYLDASSISATIASTSGGGFGVDINPAAAVTQITDTIDTTTISLSAIGTVVEGGSIIYTATLTNPAQGAVTVNLSNGSVITIADGATSGTVSVAAPVDDVYVDAGSVSATISSASGGNFEDLAIDPAPAVTTVTDSADTTTISLSATSTVAEGGSIVYTATLTHPAQGAVTVTLSNSAVITIADGATTGTVSVAAPVDDVYVDAGSVSATIATATGGNFEALSIDATPAVTAVSDTLDTTTLSLTGAASITEGASGTYTVSLTHPAQTAVTITLNYSGVAANGTDISGATSVTIPANASSASFSIAALTDGLVEGTESFTLSLGSVTGGNFENLVISGTANSVTTNIVDVDTATVSLTATPTLTEAGGTLVYTATLTSAPVSNLVVTLSNGETITILAGQTSGTTSITIAASDDVYVDPTTVSATITGVVGGDINVAVDPSAAVTTITDTIDTTTVTLSAAAAVVEGGSIVYTASVDNPVTGSALVVHLSNGVSITIPVGSSSATSSAVPVRADDVYIQGNQNLSVSISSTSGGNFEALDTTSTVTTTVTDDADITTVTLSAAAAVNEGGSIVYTASVSNPVTLAPLVVSLSNGSSITIPVGATSATSAPVSVRADDAYIQGNQNVTVSITGTSGGNYEALNTSSTATTVVSDNGSATTLTLSAAAAVNEGGSIVYTASVNNPVTGTPLVINLSNGSTITIPVGATSATSASVAVRADDAYIQGNQTLTVGVSSTSGGNFETLNTSNTVTTVVSDNGSVTTVSLSAAASVNEGGSVVYTASVSNPVTGTPLVINLNNGLSITIPVGSSSASSVPFAVRPDDAYIQGNQTLTVGVSSTSGGNFEVLNTTGTATTVVSDNGSVTKVSLVAADSVKEGASIIYIASVDKPVTGTPFVIQLSNGASITIPVGASSAASAPVAVRPDDAYVQGNQLVTVGITGTSGGNYEALNISGTTSTLVTDNSSVTSVTLSAASAVNEGGSIVYTASVNNAVTGAPLVINLSNGLSITIPVGSTSASSTPFAVRADDAYTQGNQTLTVGISSTSGGNFESLNIASTTSTVVSDNGSVTTVVLSAAASVNEGGSIVYTASVSKAVTVAPLVISLSNGSSITIPVGATSAVSAPVAVRADDAYAQGNQSLVVSITGASGGNYESLNTTSTATTIVSDNGTVTTVSLSAAANINEGGTLVYTASVNNAVAGTPLVINLSNGSSITIPVGSTSASSAPVAVRADDAYVQGNQTLTVGISSTSGGNFESLNATSTTSTVVSDNGSVTTVSLTSAASVNEGGSIVYTATVNNAVTGTPLVITLSNGSSITIPVGATSATSSPIAVRADDAYAQGVQTLVVSITGTSGGNYESLNTTSTATTTVSDNGTVTSVTLSAIANVNEGGSIVYTASVNNAVTGTPLVINLSNGSSITIPVGASSATSLPVAVRVDDVYTQGNQTLSVGISSTSGGNFESLNTTSTTSTVVSDNGSVTTVSLSAAASANEGSSIIYSASVSSAVTGTPLVITLSNGATITIPVGATSATSLPVAVRADDAYIQGNQNLTVSISGTSGGNYEALNTTGSVTTVVSDNGSVTNVSLSAATSVNEGGSIVYTASVTNPVTNTPLVISLSNGSSITIPVGATSATSSAIAVRGDDAYIQGNQNVTVNITGTSGGNYESLNTAGTVTTVVSDNGSVTNVSLSAAASVNEGGSIVYTASVSNPVTGTPLVINLNNGFSITIPVGSTSASSAPVSVRADDAYVQANQTLTVGISSTSGGNFEALDISSTATTLVSDNGSVTTVSLSAAASVNEGGLIVYTASVNNAVTGTPLVINLDTGSTITIPVGATSASSTPVAVRPDDLYTQGNQTLTVGITSTSGGNYEALGISSTVNTTVTDNATATTLSISGVASIKEGSSGVYTLTLTEPTQTAMTVTLNYSGTASLGSDFTGSTTVTIPAGATSANFTIAALTDSLTEGNENFTVSIGGTTGGNFENVVFSSSANSVTTTIIDNQAPIAVNDPGTGNTMNVGLYSEYYSYVEGTDGPNLTSLAIVNAFVATHNPNATFIAKTFDYGSDNLFSNDLGRGTNLQAFLGSDAASLSNDPGDSSDAIIRMFGAVELAAGTYNFRIRGDDGYQVKVDGVAVATVDQIQSPTGTVHAQFTVATSGIHSIEILYWDQGGQAVFKVELSDNNGVSYNLLSNKPTTYSSAHTMNEDTSWTVPVSTLLANDSDPDGDPITLVSVQDAINGTVSLSGGNVTFTPDANYYGLASYTYTISDGRGGTDTALVTMNILPVNDLTVISGVSAGESSITFTASDVDVGTILKLSAPFAATFSNPTLNNGSLTTLNIAQQSAAVTGVLKVTDATAPVDVINLSIGTSGSDTFNASGNTTATALYGFGGNDTLTGGSANDFLSGGAGNDVLNGGGGNDVLWGGTGNDTFNVTSGTDTIKDLGNGSDILVVSSGATAEATVTSAFTATSATVNNGTANLSSAGIAVDVSLATGSKGFTIINTGGGTSLTGSNSNDTLIGGTGADTLKGGAGADTIDGGAGTDNITGGAGNDILTGGSGVDTFVWKLADKGTTSAPALDKITDFTTGSGGDKLDLRDLLQGENSGNLTKYLHFTSDGTDTTISISSSGAFNGSNYATATDQIIVLNSVNLTGGDVAIINLLKTNNLLTD